MSSFLYKNAIQAIKNQKIFHESVHRDNQYFPYEIIYKNHYEDSPVMFRTIDTNGIIIACNRSYAKDLGFSKKEDKLKDVFGKDFFKKENP